MLVVAYDPLLVIASVFVCAMACFTGLKLTNGISTLPVNQKKARIVSAAIALGGGIWATHFVAMLALHLPVWVAYDEILTLISAMVAILATGAALILLHFGERSTARINIAAAGMAAGIVSMHYIGMAGLRGQCRPSYDLLGILLAGMIAVGLCMAALRLAYKVRSLRTLGAGAVGLAAAVCAMHYTAMAGTSFERIGGDLPAIPALSNRELALYVSLAVFAICGGFLLTALPLLIDPHSRFGLAAPAFAGDGMEGDMSVEPGMGGALLRSTTSDYGSEGPTPAESKAAPTRPPQRIPYQSGGATLFVDPEAVRAVKAQGHYCVLYAPEDQLFCPLSMAKLSDLLGGRGFVKTHRSYLVNPAQVIGFERRKDQAVCLIDCADAREEIPVSRQNAAEMARLLGL